MKLNNKVKFKFIGHLDHFAIDDALLDRWGRPAIKM